MPVIATPSRLLAAVLVACLWVGSSVVAEELRCPDRLHEPTFVFTERVPGVFYAVISRREEVTNRPFHVHLVKVDLQSGKAIRVLHQTRGGGRVEDLVRTAEEAGERVLVAVNGDYFAVRSEARRPMGLQTSGGRILGGKTGRSSLIVSPDGRVRIDQISPEATVRFPEVVVPIDGFNSAGSSRGTTLYDGLLRETVYTRRHCRTVVWDAPDARAANQPATGIVQRILERAGKVILKSTERALVFCGKDPLVLPDVGQALTVEVTTPGFPYPVAESLSGGPRVLRHGLLVFEGESEGFPKSVRNYLQRAHPRTAAGVDATGTTLYLLVAEGRPGGLSATGAACILRDAGATDAMLLDGGGSAVMVLSGVIVNRPHAKRKRTSRQVANALAVVASEQTVVPDTEVR